jgi:CheY-like chemotaxis protein
MAGKAAWVSYEVLVVDDDLDVRTILVESLREQGYSVREAEHGQHALELLSGEWRPQLIVLDIVMPVMDGMTFLEKKQLAEHLVHIPVVVVSATAEPPIAGARCVLRKPVEWQDLLHVISQHVAL